MEIQAIHHGPPWTSYGGDANPSDRILALGAERGLHLSTLSLTVPWPRDGQPADPAAADAAVERIRGIDPQALIIPRLHLDAPPWWKQAHPDQQQVYDDGPHPMSSPASELWRRDAEEALRGFLKHLEERYGDHMLGYHVTAQSAGEWFYDHAWEKPVPCFEEPFRAWFAQWARRKYGTVEALRAAWQQPELDFESIRVPTVEERRDGGLGLFRDPVRQRFEIDFAEAMQDCLADGVLHFAKVTREVTGGRKLTVFFYGYLFEMAGFFNGPAMTGHLKLRRLLDSPDIDLIAAPISYYDRQAGGSGPFMAPIDSIQAHGKLWVNEDDTRTHLASPDAGYGRTSTEAESLGVYARNFGHQLERRCATWWMDFGTGWMAHPTLFDQFGETLAAWQAVPPAAHRPEVAVVVDEESLLYLRAGNEVTSPAIALLRRSFNQIGCPIGLYLLSDWCEGRLPDSVRCIYALNAWRLTAAQRAALRGQRGGRTVVWLYAPGYLDEEDGAAANVSDLLGFQVVPATAPKARIEPLDSETLLGPLAPFGIDARPAPLLAVAPGQPGVTPLGSYQESAEIALAMRRGPDGTTLFCGLPTASTALLRAAARESGAWIYADSDDVVSGGPSFVSLHASSAGEKLLRLPRPMPLRDAFTGESLPAATEHRFTLALGSTRVFLFQP